MELSKEREIELLRELCSNDSYFKQIFGDDFDQMVKNIQNDFELLSDTKFDKMEKKIEQKKVDLSITGIHLGIMLGDFQAILNQFRKNDISKPKVKNFLIDIFQKKIDNFGWIIEDFVTNL